MATVTGFTAERMKEIEDAAIVAGAVVLDDLILTRHDGTNMNAGNVRGAQGPAGGQMTIAANAGAYPSSPSLGQVVYNNATGTEVFWNGTTWVQKIPAGFIMMSGGLVIPAGWLVCDGSLVSRTTYAGLFAAIGTAYGLGDGSTTFGLPNFKGKFPAGFNAADADFNALGDVGGAKTVTLTTAQMPAHTHTQDPHNHSIWGNNATGGSSAFGEAVLAPATGSNNKLTAQATATNQNTGGGGAHENLPPFLTVHFVVKT